MGINLATLKFKLQPSTIEYNMNTIDKMREDFEAWAKGSFQLERKSLAFKLGDGYTNIQTDAAWAGWKAALASIRMARGVE